MGDLKNFITPLHTSTKRKYLALMCDSKVECMKMARKYDWEYWDGDRRFGYGGYRYIPNRWKPVSESLIETYASKVVSKVLDVGCGKGFLLYEMQLIDPKLELHGLDISAYALQNRHPDLKAALRQGTAHDLSPYRSHEFDLVISLNTLHNLPLQELEKALQEIGRVSKKAYIVVESFRNEEELFNLQCWALTAESFFRPETWIYLYNKYCPHADYEFIYFE